MRLITRILILALFAASVLLMTGCEKSDPAAPSDAVIVVTASPGNISLDDLDPNGEAKATIRAEVFNAEGNPKSGVGIRFSTDIGRMESGGDSIKTDGSGIAEDKLIVSEDDEDSEATVTAASGSIAGTVSVGVGAANEPPIALFTMDPSTAKAYTGTCPPPAGSPPNVCVFFDGREGFAGSQDSDGRIVSYKWTIVPQFGAAETIEGPDPLVHGSFFRSFAQEQSVSVTLEVTDDDGATSLPTSDFLAVVGNLEPVADAGSDTQAQLGNLGGAGAVVSFDASASFDPDGVIVGYQWDFDDGIIAPVSPVAQANHNYAFAGTFFPVLKVYDNGNGIKLPTPFFWEYDDGKTSEDSRQVVIIDPNAP
jgi:hypothetical protein